MYYITNGAILFKQVDEKNRGLLNCGNNENLESSYLSRSDMMLNLEFTLGRPSWHTDHHAESSTELTLLKC